MQVPKVSFSGIYNINFPKNTSQEDVDKAYKKLNDFIQEKPYLSSTIDLYDFSKFQEKTPIKGFRIVSTLDNPHIMVKLLSLIDEKLALQYVEKTKINLTV